MSFIMGLIILGVLIYECYAELKRKGKIRLGINEDTIFIFMFTVTIACLLRGFVLFTTKVEEPKTESKQLSVNNSVSDRHNEAIASLGVIAKNKSKIMSEIREVCICKKYNRWKAKRRV